MRPVRKGQSPVDVDFKKYKDALPDLIGRIGEYCSYCERKLPTSLAVEHIEPKDGPDGRPELVTRWTNFLLACANCNSCKSDKKVNLKRLVFPDRDNTFIAFVYKDDGTVSYSRNLLPRRQVAARNTLTLLGLDKSQNALLTSNGQNVYWDRVSQRMQCLMQAREAKELILISPQVNTLKEMVIKQAKLSGFFSIWMKVFDEIPVMPEMKLRLIQAFQGTVDSGCFDLNTGNSISPAPNPDNLVHGGKI